MPRNTAAGLFLLLVVGLGIVTPDPVLAGSPWCDDPSHPAEPGMYGDIGRRYVDLVNNTDLPSGQPNVTSLFQQGLAHMYGFNLFEALRNFETAAAQSPDCALCWWGVAMSFAPNINYYVENQTRLNSAARKALALATTQPNLSPKTKRIITATAELVAPDDYVDSPDSPYRKKWADSMCEDMSPPDPDVDALCATALMALSPWNYYQGTAGGGHFPMKKFLLPAKAKLLGAVDHGAGGMPHVFAIHLLIHLLEPSNAPLSYRWDAYRPAHLLFDGGPSGELVPAQGHLTHMPAHLFLRVGEYNNAVQTSTISTSDNEAYLDKCLTPYGHGHNLKMYVANARLAGRFEDALSHARKAGLPTSGRERTPNGGLQCVDCAGPGSPEVVLTMARFGRWGSVLAEPMPTTSWGDSPAWRGYHEAAWRYARAVAHWVASSAGKNATAVALGDHEAELSRTAAASAASPTQLFNYTVIIPEQLAAARALYVGEPDWAAAIAHIRQVVEADDSNFYLEPPRVWYPPRECLGALLNAAPAEVGGNAKQALDAFDDSLQQFVESPWALYGAATAARSLGLSALAANYTARGDLAWGMADVQFVNPCPELLSQSG